MHTSYDRHVMYGITSTRGRSKSMTNFMKTSSPLKEKPNAKPNSSMEGANKKGCARRQGRVPTKFLPPGHKLPWETWRALNRPETRIG